MHLSSLIRFDYGPTMILMSIFIVFVLIKEIHLSSLLFFFSKQISRCIIANILERNVPGCETVANRAIKIN